MRWFFSLLIGGVCAHSMVQADGLVHRLPADGVSAKFDLELKISANGEEKIIRGNLVMASVGKLDVDGKPCRWLEFRLEMSGDGKDKRIIAKALIPEKALKSGENPGAAMIRAWVKDREEPLELKDLQNQRAGPLAIFLSGPVENAKKLPKMAFDNKALGKVEAAGVAGNITIDLEKEKLEVKMENRLSDKAPFGLLQSKMDFQVFRNGEARDQGLLTFTLVEVGKEAKTELPDQK